MGCQRWSASVSFYFGSRSWTSQAPTWAGFGRAETMQIWVKTLTGKTLLLDVEPTTKIGPCFSVPSYTLCGGHDITTAKIQGGSSSVLVKAAATELARFWESPDGVSVKQYLEKKVVRVDELSCCCCSSPEATVLDSEASLDELLIEASRFFILKAVNSDTAAPKLAREEETPKRNVASRSDEHSCPPAGMLTKYGMHCSSSRRSTTSFACSWPTSWYAMTQDLLMQLRNATCLPSRSMPGFSAKHHRLDSGRSQQNGSQIWSSSSMGWAWKEWLKRKKAFSQINKDWYLPESSLRMIVASWTFTSSAKALFTWSWRLLVANC